MITHKHGNFTKVVKFPQVLKHERIRKEVDRKEQKKEMPFPYFVIDIWINQPCATILLVQFNSNADATIYY